MARYRNEMDDERDYYPREERFRREALGSYEEPYSRRPRFDNERRWENEGQSDYGRGRFGERANYETDEPRYSNTRERWNEGDRYGNQGRRSTLDEIRGDLGTGRGRDRYTAERSRLRCRDIMTKDLAVAMRQTPITQVALMMKQEDTGVIPVVDYDTMGNGRSTNEGDRDRYDQQDNRIVAHHNGEILVTPGGKFALFLAAQAFVEPGVDVMVLEPAWVSYVPIVELAGGTAVRAELCRFRVLL